MSDLIIFILIGLGYLTISQEHSKFCDLNSSSRKLVFARFFIYFFSWSLEFLGEERNFWKTFQKFQFLLKKRNVSTKEKKKKTKEKIFLIFVNLLKGLRAIVPRIFYTNDLNSNDDIFRCIRYVDPRVTRLLNKVPVARKAVA